MDGNPYLAMALISLIAGGTIGIQLFGSKLGGAITAVLVFAFCAGLRAFLLSFT